MRTDAEVTNTTADGDGQTTSGRNSRRSVRWRDRQL